MRLLADACVAGSLVLALRAVGHDVEYVADGPPGVDDAVILRNAFDAGRIVITEDHDFGALAVRDSRASIGVVLIELHGLSSATKDARVLSVVRSGEPPLAGYFTVIEPTRTRSRPLEP
jgi:predicted nuclease of predicted toxin-antitoxin system